MDEIRRNRIRSAMKDELSLVINREIKDDRVPFVTITDVNLAKDGREATIMVSILEDANDPGLAKTAMENLEKAKGFLRKHLSATLQLRYTPNLHFKEDRGLENALRVNEILNQLSQEREKNSE